MVPELRIEGPRAWITLRRPQQANRLERQDLDVMLEHLRAVDAARAVRVLVLQSQGPHFCSGFNLDEVLATGPGLSAPAHFAQVADALERARPVTVAAVQGGVFGGAVDLALACDLRLGTPQAVAAVPAVRLGLQFYRTGLQRAVARLPWATAQRLYLLGQRLQAPELLQAGFFLALAGAAGEAAGAAAPSAPMAPTAPTAPTDPQGPEPHPALTAAVDRQAQELLDLGPAALLGIKRALVDIASGRVADPAVAAALDAASAATEQSAELRCRVERWRQERSGRPGVSDRQAGDAP